MLAFGRTLSEERPLREVTPMSLSASYTNRLSARIAEFLKDGKVDQEEMPAYSELTREGSGGPGRPTS